MIGKIVISIKATLTLFPLDRRLPTNNLGMFSFDPIHKVVVCHLCSSCIVPGLRSQERHLRAKPHRLTGDTLKTTVQLLDSYDLRTVEELREHRPRTRDECRPIEHLASYDGFYCLQPECDFSTRHHLRIREHVSAVHTIKAKEHEKSPLWQECKLQTYFTGKGLIDYFVIVEGPSQSSRSKLDSARLTKTEEELFVKLEKDYADVKVDIEEQASIVHDIGDSRAERVPWLHDVTGFPYHLTVLKDEEIWGSYKLPPKREFDAGGEEAEDPNLVRILVAAEAVLRDAYRLCSDTSPDRKMTQQRANILNEFYAGASGTADGFRYFKNASSLVTYFTTMKRLLVYYYRIVYCEGGHFTRTKPDQILPRDVIQPTKQQIQAMDEIMEALGLVDEEEAMLALKHAIRRLYLALIC